MLLYAAQSASTQIQQQNTNIILWEELQLWTEV